MRNKGGDCCLIEPVFSPDGTRLVHASRECKIVVDASGRSILLPGSAPGPAASWSPDGTQIAYNTSESMVVTDTTGTSTVLSGSAPGGAVSWSPDGAHIASITRDGVSVAAFPDGDTRQYPLDREKSYRTLAWSPDSSRLVCHQPYGDETTVVRDDLATGETRHVPGGFARKVVWSPDSTRVACHTDRGLLTVCADTGRLQQVVTGDNLKDVSWAI